MEDMNFNITSQKFVSSIRKYRIHLLIFLIVFFIGLTIAHPLIQMNDEWITTNQLNQLHKGHQVIINEGKFGLLENGSISSYFQGRSNVLGYSLFLPVIAMPVMWMTDLLGEHFVFFVLYVWTILAILILVLVDTCFPQYTRIGTMRWTPVVYIITFIVFFINLFFYSTFLVEGIDAFPEILSIVFINCILLAILAVFIYETNLTIFDDIAFSLFGTIVCLSCSSYFFWMTGCKDHILVVTIFAAALMSMIKLIRTNDYWYLALAFIISGFLAWARPELAFWAFAIVCGLWAYWSFKSGIRGKALRSYGIILGTPLFTLVGALPFFFNNLLVTKNLLHPPMMSYNLGDVTISTEEITQSVIQQNSGDTFQTLIQLIIKNTTVQSPSIPADLFGIFFWPQNHSIGVFILEPIAFLGIILIVYLIVIRKATFSSNEKQYLILLILICAGVFLAYLRSLNGLNTSPGVMPDIRYFTPMYIPLTLIGLIGIKKSSIISDEPLDTVKKMSLFWIVLIPLSLVILALAYSDNSVATLKFEPFNTFFTTAIIITFILTIVGILGSLMGSRAGKITNIMLPLLCSLPFIWQINASYLMWQFGQAAAYTFWIPVIRIIISPIWF